MNDSRKRVKNSYLINLSHYNNGASSPTCKKIYKSRIKKFTKIVNKTLYKSYLCGFYPCDSPWSFLFVWLIETNKRRN